VLKNLKNWPHGKFDHGVKVDSVFSSFDIFLYQQKEKAPNARFSLQYKMYHVTKCITSDKLLYQFIMPNSFAFRNTVG